MALKNCNVVFNTNRGFFYSGDIVTGTVTIFDLKHSDIVKGLTFEVKGTSRASWTRPITTMPHIKIYSEKLKILHINLNLFPDINENTKITSVPFHFALPPCIPSSFKDSISRTYYRIVIKATNVCRVTHKRIFPFVVMAYLNLNILNPSYYDIQYVYELTKKLDKFNQFQIIIKTYKGVGSNQRNIPLKAYISNEKRIKMSKIVISLIQKLEYTVLSGYHNSERKMHEIVCKDLKTNLNETYTFYMDIPAVVPSTINLERTLINISYVYKVTVFFRFHFNTSIEIPVVIGSTPLTFMK